MSKSVAKLPDITLLTTYDTYFDLLDNVCAVLRSEKV